jgi:hypothetical protein
MRLIPRLGVRGFRLDGMVVVGGIGVCGACVFGAVAFYREVLLRW